MARGKSVQTIDHDAIRKWAEDRGGRPAAVEGTDLLRIDFGEKEEKLKELPWDEFFKIFEERELALLYQEETAGSKKSRFFKFVERPNGDDDDVKDGELEDDDDDDADELAVAGDDDDLLQKEEEE